MRARWDVRQRRYSLACRTGAMPYDLRQRRQCISELHRPFSHQTVSNTDPMTQLIGPPLVWRPAWTAFRDEASRRNSRPAHYKQEQLSQSQRDIWSS